MRIGIIGTGLICEAIQYGFNSPLTDFDVMDGVQSLNHQSDSITNTHTIFVCVNTESDGFLSARPVIEVLERLTQLKYRGLVVIKSSLPPGGLDYDYTRRLQQLLRIVVNPDLTTPTNANREFVESPMIILGSNEPANLLAAKVLYNKSNVSKKWFMETTINEAILMKVFIDVFLATKSTLMGEFSDMLSRYSDRSWTDFMWMMVHDPRIGRSNTQYNDEIPAAMSTFIRTAIRNSTQSGTVAGAMSSNSLLRKNISK